jgi:glucan phosphoethanolaminetransferase (alkaline phosphatase superfamily)
MKVKVDRLRTAIAELVFWLPFSVVPLLAKLATSGDPHLFRDIIVSAYLTLVVATLTSYGFRVPLRLAALAILGFGSVFITGVALLTHTGGDRLLMHSILDSNPTEIEAATTTYGSLFHPAYLAVILIPLIALGVQWRWNLFWSPPKYSVPVLLLLFVAQLATRHEQGSWGVQSTVRKLASLFPYVYPVEAFPPLQPYAMLGDTVWARQKFADVIASEGLPMAGVSAPAAPPRTYVVVVGESLSKYHMHLYGYDRPTTPHLDALERAGELHVLRNVVTSHAQTVEALFSALTLPTEHGRMRTIIDVFNAAGFGTYWLSNQWQFSLHSFPNNASLVAELTRSAGAHVWLNSVDLTAQENQSKAHLDEQLLPALDRALADGAHRDKLVFLHLMGNHFNYDARYTEFVAFDGPARCGGDAASQRVVDEYDSSVVYNDGIVKRIIDRVAEVPGETFVLYFSDHGEEVFDFRAHAGHLDALLSPYMAEVPFMVWLSPRYRESHPDIVAALATARDRPASLENLSQSLAGLAGLSVPGARLERSLVARRYTAAPRITADRDYDAFKAAWRPDAAHAAGYPLLSCAAGEVQSAEIGK